jgi:hypothetical protein
VSERAAFMPCPGAKTPILRSGRGLSPVSEDAVPGNRLEGVAGELMTHNIFALLRMNRVA